MPDSSSCDDILSRLSGTFFLCREEALETSVRRSVQKWITHLQVFQFISFFAHLISISILQIEFHEKTFEVLATKIEYMYSSHMQLYKRKRLQESETEDRDLRVN